MCVSQSEWLVAYARYVRVTCTRGSGQPVDVIPMLPSARSLARSLGGLLSVLRRARRCYVLCLRQTVRQSVSQSVYCCCGEREGDDDGMVLGGSGGAEGREGGGRCRKEARKLEIQVAGSMWSM